MNNNKKILLLGSNGLLGSTLKNIIEKKNNTLTTKIKLTLKMLKQGMLMPMQNLNFMQKNIVKNIRKI